MDQFDTKAHHIQVDNALIGGYMDEDDPDEFNPEYLRWITDQTDSDFDKIIWLFPSGGLMETGSWLRSQESGLSREETQKAR